MVVDIEQALNALYPTAVINRKNEVISTEFWKSEFDFQKFENDLKRKYENNLLNEFNIRFVNQISYKFLLINQSEGLDKVTWESIN
jgi:hypothetical protein